MKDKGWERAWWALRRLQRALEGKPDIGRVLIADDVLREFMGDIFTEESK